MRGRKPLPESVKQAQGTLKKCRMTGTALVPSHIDYVPPPPYWFSAETKDFYFKVTNELRAKGILDARDLPMILMFCRSFSLWNEYEQKCNITRIHLIKDKNGRVKDSNISAFHKIAKQEQLLVIKMASEFGFSPAARERLKIYIQQTPVSDDDFT